MSRGRKRRDPQCAVCGRSGGLVPFVALASLGVRLVCEPCRDALLSDADEATREVNSSAFGEDSERVLRPYGEIVDWH